MSKKILLLLVTCSLQVSLTAQDSPITDVVQPSDKLLRYHTVLLKRPESSALFQRFQTAWLSQYPEDTLEQFLRSGAKSSVEGKQLLAYYLLQKGGDIEATKVLSEAILDDVKDPQLLVDRARAFARLLEFNKSLQDLDAALELIEDDEKLLLVVNKLKGRYLTRQGKTDEAVAHWLKLVKDNPRDEELSEDVIDILMSDSLAPSALKLAKELRDNTKDPYKKALRTLRVSGILVKQGKRDEALDTLDSTLELSGASSWLEREILGQIQTIYKREDNLLGHTKHLEKLSALYPQRVVLRNKLAESLSDSGDYNKAKLVYRELLKVSPNDDVIRTAYLQLLMRSEDLITARQLIDSMLKDAPNNPELHLHRASLSHQLKDKKSTVESLNNYKKHAAKTYVSALKRAELLKKYTYEDEALAAYKSVLTEFPSSVAAQFNVADYLFAKEENYKKEAQAIWLQMAKSADKSNIVALLEKLVQCDQLDLASRVISEKREQFKTDLSFLATAIQISERNKQLEIAIQDAKVLVILSKQPSEIDSAISTTSRIIGKLDAVEEEVKKLSAKESLTISERFLLANLYELNGNVVESEKIIKGLSNSDAPVALLQTAGIYERRFQLTNAAETIEKLIKLPGQLKSNYLRRLSRIYERSGNYDKALASIQKWKKLTPNDKQVWLVEVNLLEQLKGPKEALESLRKGAQKFENDTEVYAKLARLNFDLGHYSQAILLYWRLYDDSSDMSSQIRWVSELARVYQSDGRMADLVDEMNTRRRNSPKAIAPIMALAEVYKVNDQAEERRNLLLEANRLRPDEVAILYEIATIDRKEGDQAKAIEVLRKAQKIDKSGTATKKLAKLLLEEGNFDEGLRELTSLGDGKDDARTVESIALSLVSQQAHDEAKVYLTKHLLEHPSDWRLKLIDGLLDYELGYPERSFNTALELLSETASLQNLPAGWQAVRQQSYTVFNFSLLSRDYQTYFLLPRAKPVLSRLLNIGANSYYNSYQSSGVNNGLVSSLPNDIKSLKLLAYAQLAFLLDEFSPEERLEKIKTIELAGHKQINLFVSLLNSNDNNNPYGSYFSQQEEPNFLEKELAKTPNSEYLLNVKMLQRLGQFKMSLPKKELDLLIKINQENSDLYLYELATLFKADERDNEEYLLELLAAIEKADEISEIQMIAVIGISRNYTENGKNNMPQKLVDVYHRYQKEALEKGIKSKNNSPYNFNVSNTVDQYLKYFLFLSDDYEEIIKEIEATKYAGSYYSRQTSVFPPSGLNSVNAAQISLLTANSQGGISLKPERIKESLEYFKNPVLRVLARHFAEPKADLIPDIEELKKLDKYAADGHLLHAGLLQKQKKPLKQIIGQMELARAKSLSKNQRQHLDKTIIDTALGFDSPEKFDEELSKEMQESVRGVARRMLLSRMITEPEQITTVLEKLGMEKESDRFLTKDNKSIRKKLVATGGLTGLKVNSRTSPNTNSNQSRSASLKEKVNKVIEKNNERLAITLLETELKKQLRSRSGSYQLDRTKDLIKEVNLVSKVLEKFNPRESTSPRRWLSYYQVAKLLENVKGQNTAIRFLSGLSHVPSQARTPLALALYKEKPTKALELLKKSRNLSEVTSRLDDDFDDVNDNPGKYLGIMEFSEKFLASVDVKSAVGKQVDQNLSNLMSNFITVTNAYHRDNKQVLKAVKGTQLARKSKVVKALFEQALRFPTTSDSAFRLLQHFDENRDKHTDKFVKYAKDSLFVRETNTRQLSYVKSGIRENYQGKLDYLTHHILKTKNADIIDEAYLKQLEIENKPLVANLKLIKRYILADEPELIKALKSIKGSDSIVVFSQWRRLLEHRGSAKLKLEYANRLLDYMREFDQQNVEFYNKLISDAQSLNITYLHGNSLFKEEVNFIIPILYRNNKLNELIAINNDLATKILKKSEDKKKTWERWKNHSSYTNEGFRVILFKSLSHYLASNPLTYLKNLESLTKHEYESGDSYYYNRENKGVSDSLLESLSLANILTSVDQVKLEALPEGTKRKKDVFSSSDNTSEQFDLYVIQVIARSFSSYDKRESFRSKMEEFKGEKKYGAQLLMAVSDVITFEEFITKNLADIRKASKDHKLALSRIFDLKGEPRRVNFLKSKNFYHLLPFEKKVKGLKNDPETIAFLSRSKEFDRNEFYEMENFIENYIKRNIYTDLETTYKVLAHYVTLLEKSKAAGQVNYTTSSKYSNFIQVAVTDRIFDSLKREKVDQHLLLRLVYRLTKHPLHKKLSFRYLITSTMPPNWHQSVTGKKGLPAVKAILLSVAKKYKALKNEEEKLFFNTAWAVYFNSYAHYEKLHFEIGFKHSFMKDLIEKNPKHKEFLEMVDLLRNYEFGAVSYILLSSLKEPKRVDGLRRRSQKNHDAYRNVIFPQLEEFVASLPSHYKAIYFSQLAGMKNVAQFIAQDPKFLSMCLKVNIEAIEDNPSLAVSNDTRHLLVFHDSLDEVDDQLLKKWINTSEKIVVSLIEHIDKQNMVHQNHFINACLSLAATKEGAVKLDTIYKKYPEKFKHLRDVAQAFLVYGYIENAKSILPSLGQGFYQPQFDRVYHTKSVDEHLPKLLAMCDSDLERLELQALMFMKPSLKLTGKRSNYYNRVSDLAKVYSRVAKSHNDRLTETSLKIINRAASAQASVIMADHWSAFEKARPNYFQNYSAEDAKGQAVFPASDDGYMMRAYAKYCIMTKSTEENMKWITAAMKKTFSKKPLSYKAKHYLDKILGAAYETMTELYAEGKDKELKKILPLIRGINGLTVHYEVTVKARAYIYDRTTLQNHLRKYDPMALNRAITPFIHGSVGEQPAFQKWRKTLKDKEQRIVLLGNNRLPHAYTREISILSSLPEEQINENYIQFFKRLFSKQSYQFYVTERQNGYDHISYLADRGKMTSQQGLDLYDSLDIDYKVPAFESVVKRDLAHFEMRANNYAKVLEHYKSMHEILTKHPIKNRRNHVRGYIYAIEDLVAAELYAEAVAFVPETIKSMFNEAELKYYKEKVDYATEQIKEKK